MRTVIRSRRSALQSQWQAVRKRIAAFMPAGDGGTRKRSRLNQNEPIRKTMENQKVGGTAVTTGVGNAMTEASAGAVADIHNGSAKSCQTAGKETMKETMNTTANDGANMIQDAKNETSAGTEPAAVITAGAVEAQPVTAGANAATHGQAGAGTKASKPHNTRFRQVKSAPRSTKPRVAGNLAVTKLFDGIDILIRDSSNHLVKHNDAHAVLVELYRAFIDIRTKLEAIKLESAVKVPKTLAPNLAAGSTALPQIFKGIQALLGDARKSLAGAHPEEDAVLKYMADGISDVRGRLAVVRAKQA